MRHQQKERVLWRLFKNLQDGVGDRGVHLVCAIDDDDTATTIRRTLMQKFHQLVGATLMTAQRRHGDLVLQAAFGDIHRATNNKQTWMCTGAQQSQITIIIVDI